MKKIICLMLSLFIVLSITGCTPKKEYEHFTLKFYYYDSCGTCTSFKNNAIPALREEFDNNFTIEYYNLDLDSSVVDYQNTINKLVDFEYEHFLETPMIVLNNSWALIGYNGTSENKEIINEIKRSLDGMPLGSYFTMGLYIFKEDK